MQKRYRDGLTLLMVGNIEEASVGVKRLLEMDGYRVVIAATEQEAVEDARREHPGLILVDLSQPTLEAIATARRIRRRAKLTRDVPVVVIPVVTPGIEEAEASLRHNVHVTYLIEFEQLERLLSRLLHTGAAHAKSP